MLSLRWVMFGLLFMPFAEFLAFAAVSARVGAFVAFFLLFCTSAIGVMLLKREGRRLFRAMMAGGTVILTGREARDGLLTALGGLFLAIPGFISDFFGLLCLLPALSSLVRPLPAHARRPGSPGVIDLAPDEWKGKPPR